METEDYFERLREETDKAYDIAEEAREQSKDPEARVDIPRAEDLSEKASSLVIAAKFPELEDQGVAARIRELEEEYGKNDERVSFEIAREIASGDFYEFDELERACDAGIRVGVSYMTGGITTAPLEGIGDVKIRENDDGTDYLAMYYSGPIRSAGGTASAMSVLLADYVRKNVGLDSFKPSETIVKRYATEVDDYYNRVTAKQYYPEREETEMIAENVPVEVTGSPTEQIEVSNYKDLERIDTNQIRGGMCLVYLDGLPLKAPKIKKRIESWGEEFGLEHWRWVEDYLELQEELHSSGGDEEEEDTKYTPGDKYLGSITAGRPVLGHPGEKGGFRLRYGHSRTNGLAATSFHPATMEVTERFLSIGTQLKVEHPGKATVGTPCDALHPPVVRMKNGDVVELETREEAREKEHDIEEILFLGDILVTYGEFVENGKRLLPSPYVEEWWEKDLEAALQDKDVKLGRDFSDRAPTPGEAFKISDKLDIPLHPRWTYHWDETTPERFEALHEAVNSGSLEGDQVKRCLEDILLEHRVEDGEIKVEEADMEVLLELLEGAREPDVDDGDEILDYLEEASGYELKPQAPHYIGARMGRPEKAEKRTLEGRPQLLFPCGREEGGRMRNLAESYKKETVRQSIVHNRCPECGDFTYFSYCVSCDVPAEEVWFCSDCGKQFDEEQEKCGSCGNEYFNRHRETDIEVKQLLDEAMENVDMRLPELLKSPRGMSGEHRHVEPIEKGLIRQKYGLYVNKDGTVRYDATDLPMTHFRPEEISVPVEKLRELGYEEDVDGEPLKRSDQVVALKPQDIVIPDSENTLPASDYLVNVAKFVDETLEKLYGLEPYYDVESKEDLVGELVIGLAPHTSGGTVGRIIGFTDAKGIYAHPYWHAGKRRNCMPGDSEVKMADGSCSTLRELFDGAEGEAEADSAGTIEKEIDRQVVTVDTTEVTTAKASKVIKTPAQDHKIEFETRSGRKIEVFPDHRMKTASGVKRARELGEGDKLVTPLEVDVEVEDRDTLNLANQLSGSRRIMVRGAEEKVDSAIDELGGLKTAANKLSVPKKSLGNYRYRGSIPLDLYRTLMEKSSLDNGIPDEAGIAAKADTVELDTEIELDTDFMRLLGFYLAEGYTRKSEKEGKEFYQVCLSFGEKELKKDIRDAIHQTFDIEPGEQDHTLVISSRLVYELFESLGLGSGAHEKRVPDFVKRLPEEKVAEMLSAYFAGDGSVEKGRLHVQATSVSRELLDDIDFLLKRFGIYARYSQSEREAGGILVDKYGEEHYQGRTFVSNKLHIRSSHAVNFGKEIGFTLERKQETLENDYSIEGQTREKREGQLVKEEIREIEVKKSDDRFMYDIEVEGTHNFVTKDNIVTQNCDGDEDAILLLMDGLLNFSRQFLPDMTGARTMDAPLILSTVLNPDEVDDEAWAIETVDEYPRSFYEETYDYRYPWELETEIEIGEDIVHSKEPFRHGYTHETSSVENGPNQSEYVTLDEMSEKTQQQLGLGRRIKAVDEDDVAGLLLKKHFIPDIKGNLRSFSSQEMRCNDCNTKYRRVPMTAQTIAPTGKTTAECPECGGKILLTISEGTIKKYLEPSRKIIENFEVSPYVRQQILILKDTLQSLFGKDKRQTGIKQFTA
ncbi:MAG: DNA polymerase II large subunit [Candidatus Nanohaloarchaea archaeon]